MDNRPLVPSNGGQGGQYFPSLSVQEEASSLYNITFEEVHDHDQLENESGKPLNVDDELIIRNVISVEESDQYQPVQNTAPSSSSSNSSSFLGNFNLNGASSKKAIDEVWKEIANQEHVKDLDNQLTGQQLGETTLEDFLVIRAGVINKRNQNGVFNHQPIMEVDPAQQFQIQQQEQEQMRTTVLEMECSNNFQMSSESVNNYEKRAVGYSDNQLVLPVTMPLSATSSGSRVPAAEKKCRFTDDDHMMRKTIERRQKRMIKNRESAARSRARKQAYTNQLEHVVLHSRNTNYCLKKQKELDILLSSSDLTPMPRFQLRRTSSASF